MKAKNIDLNKRRLWELIDSIEDNSIIDKLINFLSPSEKKTKTIKFPSMTKQEIIDQAILADKEIEQGKTTPHDEFYKEFKKW